MNNDTLVDEHFLEALRHTADKKAYELIGPAIFYMSEPEKIWSLGERVVPGTLIGYSRYREESLPQKISDPYPVDFLNGCSMLIHRSVFEKIGLFDTSLFMYAEEVDFCWRAHRAGFQMACAVKAKMWHKVSASAIRVRKNMLYLRIRNQIYFYRRYVNIVQFVIMFIFSSVRNLIISSRYLIRGMPELAIVVIQGWWKGWTADKV